MNPTSIAPSRILTAKSEKDSVVEGLRAGADDYLTKPFHNQEPQARVGVGVRNIGLHQEIEAKNLLLKELALTDALTGLPNRRAIDDWAKRQLSAAARYRFSFWVVAADLDHFKTVNDTYGHEAGDTVLKTFSEILKANSRNSDICGRIGGEEFLCVITHATKQNAWLAVERIRTALEVTRFVFDGRNLLVTATSKDRTCPPLESSSLGPMLLFIPRSDKAGTAWRLPIRKCLNTRRQQP